MRAPFAQGSEQPLDLLRNAADVCRLLADLAPAMVQVNGLPGLSVASANGLALVLDAVETTIAEALERLRDR
ncbi:MAG TPA: hypothetical protein ENN06_12635 [Desulfobacteraceae bacterium]|nr:hypothetical protein [Desulfobacteraceae bacterium]